MSNGHRVFLVNLSFSLCPHSWSSDDVVIRAGDDDRTFTKLIRIPSNSTLAEVHALLDKQTLYIRENATYGYREAELVDCALSVEWDHYLKDTYIFSDRMLEDSLLLMERRGWVDNLLCWWGYRRLPPDQTISNLYDDAQRRDSDGDRFKIVVNEMALYDHRLNHPPAATAATLPTADTEVKKANAPPPSIPSTPPSTAPSTPPAPAPAPAPIPIEPPTMDPRTSDAFARTQTRTPTTQNSPYSAYPAHPTYPAYPDYNEQRQQIERAAIFLLHMLSITKPRSQCTIWHEGRRYVVFLSETDLSNPIDVGGEVIDLGSDH